MKRFLAFPLVRLVLIVLIFGALVAPVVIFVHPQPRNVWRGIAVNWIFLTCLVVAIFVVERFAAEKNLLAVGLGRRNAAHYFALGALLGAALISTVMVELDVAGFYRVTGANATLDPVIAALVLLPSAAIEELLFRGVLFRLVEEFTGTWIALGVSAALFGLAHAANPGATWVSSLAIALEAGVLLGAAFVVTRNLWFPIGLHFAWNFFEGPIYGTQISGNTILRSALSARLTGPAIVTGGAFGPEAGVVAIGTCVVAAVALLVVAKRRGRIVTALRA
jgi:membrane protease YdiL (CAAX protease family)